MKLNIIKLLLISSLWILNGCGGGGSSTSSTGESTEKPITAPLDEPAEEPADTDRQAPFFTTGNTFSIRENTVTVSIIHAEDNSSVSYSLSGTDGSLFVLNRTSGKLKFKTAPNFESPEDMDSDNIYEIIVNATDAQNNQAQQDINITVTDINESASTDSDGDYIPDNIEILIESNLSDSDMNNNGTDDGLDTEGVYGDTFFDKQWHIRSLGTATNDSGIETIVGNDLDLLELYHHYMGYNHGENIIVQVVDTGVDADHEDLEDNMDLSRSYNGGNTGDPSGNHSHGTKVAGIMAARAFNGKGVRGIAPFAKIAGSNWLNTQGTSELEKVWLSGEGANEIAISNNSWGTYFDTDTLYEDIMARGTDTLRDGKGRIYVFAAGNDRETKGNANLQYLLSNRYAIAVTALKHDNTHADYSTPGSNILVSGYSGNYYQDSPTIGTTTIMGASSNTGNIDTKTTWSEDTHENYSFAMNGTSAASPTVAASIALVLEACPDLIWRDIRYLTAIHAKKVDTQNPSWQTNAAGLAHSTDYGYGLIDAAGMIADCSSNYILLSTEQTTTVTKNFNTQITDDNTLYTFDLNVTDNITVEWVEVTIDNSSSYASDYRVELISAKDTNTTLIMENSTAPSNWMQGGFRFGSAAFIDETSQGVWQVRMTDKLSGDNGTLKNIQIKIYGH